MRGEAWFYVADNDVFPETFMHSSASTPGLKQAFLEVHGEILTAEWWRGMSSSATGRRTAGGAAVSPAPGAGGEQLLGRRKLRDLSISSVVGSDTNQLVPLALGIDYL